ncbi:MAG: hypothetical protein AAF414_24905, partial [Pseudomonadota bacterium]
MRLIRLVLVGVLVPIGTPASAQGDPCLLSDRLFFETVAELFEGDWQVQNNGGYSFVNGNHGEIPAGAVAEPATLIVSDDGTHIVLNSSNMPEPVELRFAENLEINLEAETQIPRRLMTNEDLGTVSGCHYRDLAHLDGSSTVEFGGEMTTVSYRLTILGESFIHGVIWTEGTWNDLPSW